MKTCSKCKVSKEDVEFSFKKVSIGALQSQCKICFSASSREYYLNNIKKHEKPPTKIYLELIEKKCCRCGILKKSLDFYVDKRLKSGLRAACKKCELITASQWNKENPERVKENNIKNRQNRRHGHIFKFYGITPVEYDLLLKNQGSVCAICGGLGKNKSLGVDHDHQTGKIRGLLCNNCNAGIGLLGDSIPGILKALEYLRKNLTN